MADDWEESGESADEESTTPMARRRSAIGEHLLDDDRPSQIEDEERLPERALQNDLGDDVISFLAGKSGVEGAACNQRGLAVHGSADGEKLVVRRGAGRKTVNGLGEKGADHDIRRIGYHAYLKTCASGAIWNDVLW